MGIMDGTSVLDGFSLLFFHLNLLRGTEPLHMSAGILLKHFLLSPPGLPFCGLITTASCTATSGDAEAAGLKFTATKWPKVNAAVSLSKRIDMGVAGRKS